MEDRAPRDAAAPLGRLEGRDANVGSRRGREGPAHGRPRREAEGLVGAVRPTADRPLVVHSDGGAVYMGDDWARACEAGHVTRSMSRKARSPDNPRCEGFFGTLKSDFFGGRDWAGVTFEEFSRRLDAYIEWYRSEKVKKALRWKSIRRHREELGYTA